MNKRYLLSLIVGSMLSLSILHAQPAAGGGAAPAAPGRAGPGAPGGAPQAPKTDLEKQMTLINDAQMRAFGAGQPADLSDASKKDEALKRIATIKAAATEALKLSPKYTPPTVTSDADKAKYIADFQATMKKFIGAIETLETAVKAGKTADAPGLWDAANNIHSDAHTTFKAPRGRGGQGGPGAPGGARGPGGAPAAPAAPMAK